MTRLLFALALLAGCRAAPLPDLGTIPEFTLVERSGRPARAADLAGTVWIADFVFTHCPDFCPALTQAMSRLQRDLAAHGSGGVRFVSFSVDPQRDTPEALRAYADANGARDGWTFVTGDRDAVARLLRDGFHVAWADDGPASNPITHSDRFVLVDRQRRIRGYYHGLDPDDRARLLSDAVRLQTDPAA